MSDLIDDLDIHFEDRSFIFTMDNLNIHKHQLILHLIHVRGHRVVFRAPYWSCDGAIEYVFNTIHVKLQMTDTTCNDANALIAEINGIIFHMVDSSF